MPLHIPHTTKRWVHALEAILAIAVLTGIAIILAYHAGHASLDHAPKGASTLNPGGVVATRALSEERINYAGYIKKTNEVIFLRDGETYTTTAHVGNHLLIHGKKPVTLEIVGMNAATGAVTVTTK